MAASSAELEAWLAVRDAESSVFDCVPLRLGKRQWRYRALIHLFLSAWLVNLSIPGEELGLRQLHDYRLGLTTVK